MAIAVQCSCGKTLQAPERLAGKTARCPACKTVVAIPLADDLEELEEGSTLVHCSKQNFPTNAGPVRYSATRQDERTTYNRDRSEN